MKMNSISKTREVNKDRLALMHRKISTAPKILSETAGRSSCCIYRVPQSLVDINGQTYRPELVSIGPYHHHGHPQLQVMEEHKWRYLKLLLKRTQSQGLDLEQLLKSVQPLEARARDCYAQILHLDSDEFIEILVLDGCFIIEFFRRVQGLIPFEADDPLSTITLIGSLFSRDLIRIENQIPFFILDCLFQLTQIPGAAESENSSLAVLTLNFFSSSFQMRDRDRDHDIAKYRNLQGMHILDFLRSSFIPPEELGAVKIRVPINTRVIRRISRMKRWGFSAKPVNKASFLSIKFNKGVIEWPTIALDDFMTSFLLNCVAYEQSHSGRSKHMTSYAVLLDCLIVTSDDAEYLSDHNIIENYIGTNDELVRFVNNMAKGVVLDIEKCYLTSFFNEVAEYARTSWYIHWVTFLYPYFNTPWACISAFAAFTLLVLTLLQTLFTILCYVNPRN